MLLLMHYKLSILNISDGFVAWVLSLFRLSVPVWLCANYTYFPAILNVYNVSAFRAVIGSNRVLSVVI